jgi:sugar O-acyltransferase (sialic acid O-acetyltransferase NeuD family)
MEEIVLVGGGGHCRSCIDVIESGGKYKIAGIVDIPGKLEETVLSYRIFATDSDLEELAGRYRNFFITVGQLRDPKPRVELFGKLKNLPVSIPTIISAHAYVSRHAVIGEGSIIMHGAVVNANAKIGNNCIINSNSLIEHDAVIHDHCHIATGALINGGVIVGESTFIGSGSVTKQYINIPSNSFIPAHTLMK